jgi:hypothetical protein
MKCRWGTTDRVLHDVGRKFYDPFFSVYDSSPAIKNGESLVIFNKDARVFKHIQCGQMDFIELIVCEYAEPKPPAMAFPSF